MMCYEARRFGAQSMRTIRAGVENGFLIPLRLPELDLFVV